MLVEAHRLADIPARLPEFWQSAQRRNERGELIDFFPYPESLRFAYADA